MAKTHYKTEHILKFVPLHNILSAFKWNVKHLHTAPSLLK